MNNHEWKEYVFSDFVDINPSIPLDSKEDYSFIEMKDLNPSQKFAYPSIKKPLTGGARFQESDTLFARITPCLENGKICQAKNLDNGVGFGSTEFLVFRGKKGISDTGFVYYLSRYSEVHQFGIKNLSGTSGRQRVNKEAFNNLKIFAPPLHEQRAIADVLSALDDKIDLNHRMNQTLESLAQAIFKHMFLDNPERESWEDGEVKDLGVIVTGKTPSTFDRDFYNGDIPFVTIPDMHGNVFILETGKTLSEKGENSQKNKTLPPFSICVSCIATPGLVSITTKRSQTNQQINSIIPYYHSLTYYCYYALKDLSYEIISRGSGGSVVINLNKGQFELLPIKIPPKQFIEKFDNLVSPIFLKLLNNQKEIITLADLRDTLLPKLMSGQVRVN